jgi:hypothetical protein
VQYVRKAAGLHPDEARALEEYAPETRTAESVVIEGAVGEDLKGRGKA